MAPSLGRLRIIDGRASPAALDAGDLAEPTGPAIDAQTTGFGPELDILATRQRHPGCRVQRVLRTVVGLHSEARTGTTARDQAHHQRGLLDLIGGIVRRPA